MSNEFVPYSLVVDDEPLIRMHAADILEAAGFRTREAGSGEEAIEILKAAGKSITLLFTDVQMPGAIDGFSLARDCAHNWPHISILVASGAVEPKPDDLPPSTLFIAKPFDETVVYDRLQVLLPDGMKPAPLLERAD